MDKRNTDVNNPVSASAKAMSAARVSAKTVHSRIKRSQTLVRKATKKPLITKSSLPSRGRVMDIAKSSSISRFAKQPVLTKTISEEAPQKRLLTHPMLDRMNFAKNTQAPHKPSMKETKELAIKEAVSKIQPKEKQPKAKKPKRKALRYLYVLISLVLLASGLAALYYFVPAFSVRVAASQAGFNATYPSYSPEGYAFSGPATFSGNKIYLKYSGQNSLNFQITQEKSSWDSSAVKENIASKWANHSPARFEEQGQNVYYAISSDETKAAWVSGGILYQLSSNTGLSYDNIRRIVNSM